MIMADNLYLLEGTEVFDEDREKMPFEVHQERMVKKPNKRGRKPSKIDVKAKLERSRQSARECRARKKLRYQYLEELVASRERAIHSLRAELETVKQVCSEMDNGTMSKELLDLLKKEAAGRVQKEEAGVEPLGDRVVPSCSSYQP